MWVRAGCRGVFKCNGVAGVKCDPCDPASSCPQGAPPDINVCKCTPPPRPRKYLLLDDRNIVSATGGARLVLGQVTKHPAGPLIKEERDYEMRFDNMQPNVWYEPRTKKWRAWYSAFTSCSKPKESVPYCNNAPQTCGSTTNLSKNHADRGSGLLYAESDDGITWVKPNLNRTLWKGSTANNLIELGGMTTQIYLDEETSDDAQRYKIATGSNGAGAIAVSADGIAWDANATRDLSRETHARWDTPKNVVWDPERKQWILYVRMTPTPAAAAGTMRVQAYTHSLTSDFMGPWAPATPTGLNSSFDYQPVSPTVFSLFFFFFFNIVMFVISFLVSCYYL